MPRTKAPMRTEYEHVETAPQPTEQDDAYWHRIRVAKDDDERIGHFEEMGYKINTEAEGNNRKLLVMQIPKAVKQERYLESVAKARKHSGQHIENANQGGVTVKQNREHLSDILARMPATDRELDDSGDLSDQ